MLLFYTEFKFIEEEKADKLPIVRKYIRKSTKLRSEKSEHKGQNFHI